MDHMDRGLVDGRPFLRQRLDAAGRPVPEAMKDDESMFPGNSAFVILAAMFLAAMVAVVLLACKVKDGEAERQELEASLYRSHSQRDACTLTLRRLTAGSLLP